MLRNRRVLTCEFDEFCYDFDSVLRAEAKHPNIKSRNLCALVEHFVDETNLLVIPEGENIGGATVPPLAPPGTTDMILDNQIF